MIFGILINILGRRSVDEIVLRSNQSKGEESGDQGVRLAGRSWASSVGGR